MAPVTFTLRKRKEGPVSPTQKDQARLDWPGRGILLKASTAGQTHVCLLQTTGRGPGPGLGTLAHSCLESGGGCKGASFCVVWSRHTQASPHLRSGPSWTSKPRQPFWAASRWDRVETSLLPLCLSQVFVQGRLESLTSFLTSLWPVFPGSIHLALVPARGSIPTEVRVFPLDV